jgi:hypothetical protein
MKNEICRHQRRLDTAMFDLLHLPKMRTVAELPVKFAMTGLPFNTASIWLRDDEFIG